MINTDQNIEELLKKFSIEDLEKLKMLFSSIPGNEQKEIVTLRVFKDEYLNYIKQSKSKSYWTSVRLAFNHLINFFGLQYSMQSLQQKDAENFINVLQQKVKPVSHSASRGGQGYIVYYRNLKAAFNKAKDWGYVKENYFMKIKLPKRQKLAPVFVNSDQLSVIINKIKNNIVKDVIVFAFHTGMRLDEIVNLKWKNIDLGNRIITVGDEEFTTKGRNQRFIPMSDEAYTVLTTKIRTPSFILPPAKAGQALDKGEIFLSYVFCKENGEKFTGNYFSKAFKKACLSAGLDDTIHFHSLRHSFASNLVQKGVPLYTIKELLGHSSISTTEIYSHLNMETLREAIKKLDQTLSCVLPPSLRSGQAFSKEEKSVVKIFKINSAEKG